MSGTIADLGDSLLVNSRLISTETAKVQSAASTTIRKDDSTKRLLSSNGSKVADSGTGEVAVRRNGMAKLPLREDFSAYKDGDTTDWGKAATVVTGADGRKWLSPVENAQKPVGIDLDLPDNAYIEFDYSAMMRENGDQYLGKISTHAAHVLSGITLIDEAGTDIGSTGRSP